MDALSIQSITQPVVVKEKAPPKGRRQRLVDNPFWDTAPRGAYYKARRLSAFLNFLVTRHHTGNIARLLERLSNYVWIVPKGHFDGFIRTIKSHVARALVWAPSSSKSPEALVRIGPLTKNPASRRVVSTHPGGVCRADGTCAEMRGSSCLELVRRALKCMWMHRAT